VLAVRAAAGLSRFAGTRIASAAAAPINPSTMPNTTSVCWYPALLTIESMGNVVAIAPNP
jgi:hypothetical protein